MGTNMCCLKITNKNNKYQLHLKILHIMNSSTYFLMHACKHLAVKLKNLKLEKYNLYCKLIGKTNSRSCSNEHTSFATFSSYTEFDIVKDFSLELKTSSNLTNALDTTEMPHHMYKQSAEKKKKQKQNYNTFNGFLFPYSLCLFQQIPACKMAEII